MKHLNSFNESSNDLESEIKEFSYDHLSYLIDDNFMIYFLIRRNRIDNIIHKTLRVLIKTQHSNKYINGIYLFKWADIKYDYITYISFISKKYKILSLVSRDKQFTFKIYNGSSTKTSYYSINDILSDNVPDDLILMNIKFHLDLEK